MTIAGSIAAWLRKLDDIEGSSKYKSPTPIDTIQSLIELNTLQQAQEIMDEVERDHAAVRSPEHKPVEKPE